SVCDGIAALGGQVTELPDGMILFGSTGGKLRGGAVDSHGDHRIVMAFAVLASVLDEPVTIIGAEAVNKSYPAFFDHFAALGGKFEIV
ncbi:MAG: 3-phosphoshikimate 1-carboxyvinyltransferase, partial [Oscillospiraceae bacterium]|nr:3-phosphoshikimate 1-carboxyvinyltransferase [Oscillospiraceae bacterium]